MKFTITTILRIAEDQVEQLRKGLTELAPEQYAWHIETVRDTGFDISVTVYDIKPHQMDAFVQLCLRCSEHILMF